MPEQIQKTIKMSKLLFNHPQLILVLERFEIKLGVREENS